MDAVSSFTAGLRSLRPYVVYSVSNHHRFAINLSLSSQLSAGLSFCLFFIVYIYTCTCTYTYTYTRVRFWPADYSHVECSRPSSDNGEGPLLVFLEEKNWQLPRFPKERWGKRLKFTSLSLRRLFWSGEHRLRGHFIRKGLIERTSPGDSSKKIKSPCREQRSCPPKQTSNCSMAFVCAENFLFALSLAKSYKKNIQRSVDRRRLKSLWRRKCVRRAIFRNVKVMVGGRFVPFNPYFVCNTAIGSLCDMYGVPLPKKLTSPNTNRRPEHKPVVMGRSFMN